MFNVRSLCNYCITLLEESNLMFAAIFTACINILLQMYYKKGGLQYTRIAVAFARWNFLFLDKNKKIQRANATAFRVYCKYKIHPAEHFRMPWSSSNTHNIKEEVHDFGSELIFYYNCDYG